MAGRSAVKQHTRRTKDGKSVKVQQHSRAGQGGRGRKKKSLARRGGANLLQAFRYARRKKKAAATFCVVLGTAQLGSFLALRGLSLAAASVAIIATAVAGLAFAASSGGSMPGSGRK